MKKYLIILCCAMALSCSDSKDDIIDEGLSLSTHNLEFLPGGQAASGSTASVTVSSLGEWTLVGKSGWCTPSAQSGRDGDVVTFTVSPNPEEDDRQEVFTFMTRGASAKLTVSQGMPTVAGDFGQTVFPIHADGGYVTVMLKANTVDYEIQDEWITTPRTRAVETKWLQFIVGDNQDWVGRTGTIVFYKGTENEQVITIEQQQRNRIALEKTFIREGLGAGTAMLEVKSNVAYTHSIDSKGSGWLTMSEQSQSTEGNVTTRLYRFSFPDAADSRVGTVSFKYTADAGANVDLKVKQQRPDAVFGNFPSERFRNALGDRITVDDGELCEITYKGVETTSLSLGGNFIESLEGVEHFPNLETLNVATNRLTYLDVSKNTKLTSLVIQNNAIQDLILGDVDVKVVDLNNRHYHQLGDELTKPQYLKVTSTKLESLLASFDYGSGRDGLVWVDVSECPALVTLECERNTNLFNTLWLKTGQTIENLTISENVDIKYR